MKTLIAFIFIALGGASAAKLVCYYSAKAFYYNVDGAVSPEDLDPSLCTHLNYAFAEFNSNGTLRFKDPKADIDYGGYKKAVALKEKNPDLKVLLSVGGPDVPAQNFSSLASDSGNRANFVASARDFVETHGFDGIDIQWEVPGSTDKENFVALLQELKNDFTEDGWEVSAAVVAEIGDGYDAPAISDILDHISVMAYDMYGPWSQYTGQNSPLYASSNESTWEQQNLNMDAAITHWTDAGVAPDKLLAGMAFYGRSFTLQNPNDNRIHAPITGIGSGGPTVGISGIWSHIDFCEEKPSWHCSWDAEQRAQICYNEYQWLGVDNEGSLRTKVGYIKSHHLGGAMVWSIDQDDVFGRCGDPYPMMHAIADNLL